jgi:pimeloyl-ACP methyl ester carboxylesterase
MTDVKTVLNRSITALSCLVVLSACSREPAPEPDAIYGRGGETLWIEVADGRLKSKVYATTSRSEQPLLVVVLHGDLYNPTPSYQYAFAQALARGFDAPALPAHVRARFTNPPRIDDVVAVGLLRPGYTDNAGDRSAGERGRARGDNFTPMVVDAIADAVEQLHKTFTARGVVLVGHSGGATIAANILGRRPDVADAALLVACGCGPTRSLQPLDLAPGVRRDVVVRLLVGSEDETTPPDQSRTYATTLQRHGVDAEMTVVPGLGHNIMFQPVIFAALERLLSRPVFAGGG